MLSNITYLKHFLLLLYSEMSAVLYHSCFIKSSWRWEVKKGGVTSSLESVQFKLTN